MIKHTSETSKGRFFIEDDQGEVLAEMTYSQAGSDKIIIDHTQVSVTLKGQGVGKQLVLAAVEQARQEGLKVIPLCTFAKSIFDKNQNLQDVLF